MHELRRQLRFASASARSLDELSIDINPGHLAAGSHTPRELEGGVPGSRTNVEHQLTRLKIERTQQRLHRRMIREDFVVRVMTV